VTLRGPTGGFRSGRPTRFMVIMAVVRLIRAVVARFHSPRVNHVGRRPVLFPAVAALLLAVTGCASAGRATTTHT
jgi:hypothetical protein